MFLLNSRLGPLTAAPQGSTRLGASPQRAPLLPKLRGQFAEFLNEGSLAHLTALAAAHQCRFAVRAPPVWLEAFLGGTGSAGSPSVSLRLPAPLSLTGERICLSTHA